MANKYEERKINPFWKIVRLKRVTNQEFGRRLKENDN